MELLKKIHKRESGQAMVLALVLMLVGGLIIAPLMSYMGSGLKAGQVYEDKMDKLYTSDAGVEDAVNKILNNDSHLDDQHLDENESYWYHLDQQGKVNSQSVNVTITKLSPIEGLLGEDEISHGHEGGGHGHVQDFTVNCSEPQPTQHPAEGYIEYSCTVSFTWNGTGDCNIESAGAFFSPFPGAANLISGPYDWQETGSGVMTGFMAVNKLEAGSPEAKIVPGGFAFLWRWTTEPLFHAGGKNPEINGAFNFKFKIYSLDWGYALYFAWGTFGPRSDVSDETSNNVSYQWLIEATTGWWWWWYTDPNEVGVRAAVVKYTVGGIGKVAILTWEINPPHQLGFP
jgi:hypothetical protein